MADTFFERLTGVVAARGPVCVGLDPSRDLLEHWGLADDAAGTEALARIDHRGGARASRAS